MAAPKHRVLRQWTEFERHTLGVELVDSDPAMYEALLRVMRRQDEIVETVEELADRNHNVHEGGK